MGFSPKVKEEALKRSARHCSVCHRYKGVKMEVHHLIQEADGGPNTLENAIPLCFDCHSDAGHFNNRHPKGSKLSIPGLTKSRDSWYNFVSENSIPEKLLISEHLQTSYYVLHTLEILETTLANDFSSVNKFRAKTYLPSNDVSKFWSGLLKAHKQDYKSNIEQELIVELRQFATLKEYQNTYKNVSIIDKGSDEYPYYEAKRDVNWAELLKMDIPNSFITQLSQTGIKAAQVCVSLLHKNGDSCGGETPVHGYTEYLEIAPLSFIFLGITNVSRKPIKLNSLATNKEPQNRPNFNLQSMEMVLVPLATAANLVGIDSDSIRLEHRDGDRGEDFSKVLNTIDFEPENLLYVGEQLNPRSVIYNDNEGEYEVDIHKLDFNNLYSINSYWQCGSCPHLFFKTIDSKQEYSRELLVSSSDNYGVDYILIPPLISHVIIRELEDEITYLDRIIVNGTELLKNKVLHKGDFLEFPVSPNDRIEIYGKYVPLKNNNAKTNDLWVRNHLVMNSNNNYNNKKASLQQCV
jgi:hypothetical protein